MTGTANRVSCKWKSILSCVSDLYKKGYTKCTLSCVQFRSTDPSTWKKKAKKMRLYSLPMTERKWAWLIKLVHSSRSDIWGRKQCIEIVDIWFWHYFFNFIRWPLWPRTVLEDIQDSKLSLLIWFAQKENGIKCVGSFSQRPRAKRSRGISISRYKSTQLRKCSWQISPILAYSLHQTLSRSLIHDRKLVSAVKFMCRGLLHSSKLECRILGSSWISIWIKIGSYFQVKIFSCKIDLQFDSLGPF